MNSGPQGNKEYVRILKTISTYRCFKYFLNLSDFFVVDDDVVDLSDGITFCSFVEKVDEERRGEVVVEE